ncbi:MAG: Sensor protein, partial [uncultured bacterium]
MKILIVEDYPMNSLILEKILIKEGYEVRVANNGEEGLSRLFASKYDAIITDIMMPKMDGIEFISKIRCNISDPPPILVLTAISSKEIREKALSLGADIYLSKPVSPKEVLDSVEKCIALRNQPINASKINRLEKTHGKSPFIGVFIGASTGGPNALKTLFTDFSYPEA